MNLRGADLAKTATHKVLTTAHANRTQITRVVTIEEETPQTALVVRSEKTDLDPTVQVITKATVSTIVLTVHAVVSQRATVKNPVVRLAKEGARDPTEVMETAAIVFPVRDAVMTMAIRSVLHARSTRVGQKDPVGLMVMTVIVRAVRTVKTAIALDPLVRKVALQNHVDRMVKEMPKDPAALMVREATTVLAEVFQTMVTDLAAQAVTETVSTVLEDPRTNSTVTVHAVISVKDHSDPTLADQVSLSRIGRMVVPVVQE
jgi:hypothetical protein